MAHVYELGHKHVDLWMHRAFDEASKDRVDAAVAEVNKMLREQGPFDEYDLEILHEILDRVMEMDPEARGMKMAAESIVQALTPMKG